MEGKVGMGGSTFYVAFDDKAHAFKFDPINKGSFF